MTLHIFNPEHDIALATNLSNFTAPHAGRQLRNDLGFLPALWAEDGDQILVSHEEVAMKQYRRICHRLKTLGITESLPAVNPKFTSSKVAVYRQETSSLQPWGWDKAIRRELERMGFLEPLLPTMEQTELVRQLSHRRTSAQLLPLLQMEGTVGKAWECTTTEQVTDLLQQQESLVLKAPWSSSGRGVRFVRSVEELSNVMNWISNILKTQGAIL